MIRDTKQVLMAAWRAYAKPFPTYFSVDHDEMEIACSGIPVPLINAAYPKHERVLSHSEFARLAREFTEILSERDIPGLLIVRSAQVETRMGIAPLFHMPGMVAGELVLPTRKLAQVDIREVRGEAMAREISQLNAESHGMTTLDAEWMTCAALWEAPAPNHGFLAYEHGEAAAAGAATFVEGVSYIGWMATREKYRGRGYAEAILRHMNGFMRRTYGVTESVLHATEMGRPLYERVGFRTVDNYSVFLCAETESAAHV